MLSLCRTCNLTPPPILFAMEGAPAIDAGGLCSTCRRSRGLPERLLPRAADKCHTRQWTRFVVCAAHCTVQVLCAALATPRSTTSGPARVAPKSHASSAEAKWVRASVSNSTPSPWCTHSARNGSGQCCNIRPKSIGAGEQPCLKLTPACIGSVEQVKHWSSILARRGSRRCAKASGSGTPRFKNMAQSAACSCEIYLRDARREATLLARPSRINLTAATTSGHIYVVLKPMCEGPQSVL